MFSYEILQTLNHTEMTIYRYLTANVSKIPYMSIRELANELKTSTATILRFCYKINLKGYNDLKKHVEKANIIDEDVTLGQDIKELLLYFQQANTEGFEKNIADIVLTVAQTEKIFFIGLGSSGSLARYGARYFSNLGKFSIGLEDQNYPITNDMTKNSIVIVLSVSGETVELINFIDRCREKGCPVLSITNNATSRIAEMADMKLTYNVTYQMGPEGHNATTQVPVMFLIEAIGRRL